MDIDALKTFLEVYRCRHFGQAAKNLYLSQSTVSARIKLLEDRVGVPLFVRQRNNLQLTPSGNKLINYADNIVTSWNRALQAIAIIESDRVPLIVGAQPSLWDSVLGDWIKFIYREKPEVIINLEVHGPEMLSRRIQDRTMDIAFVFDHPQVMEFECTELTDIPLVMVSSKPFDNPVDATTNNYIYVDWGTSFSIAHARYFPDLGTPKIRIMLGRIALDYLIANGGTAYLPKPMIEILLTEKKLFQVKDAPVIKRNVYAIYAHESEYSDLINLSCSYFAK